MSIVSAIIWAITLNKDYNKVVKQSALLFKGLEVKYKNINYIRFLTL